MSFWGEMRRRNVFKVGAAYLVVAWLLAQIVDVVLPTFDAPNWVSQTIILLLILLFPVILIVAWAFEITPEGIKKTSSVPVADSITATTGQRLNYIVIGLMAVAIAFLVVDNYVLDDAARGPAAPSSDARRAADASSDGSTRPGTTEAPVANAADSATPSDSGARPAARLENSVAVLPFNNLSPDPDNAYFAAGIHEEVLNQLSKLSNLSVISRTSMMRYADSPLSVPEIASELNVETVMEGSVRYAGTRIRVTMQLIDAATDQHLWSETYDREFDDIFAIESDIAMNVANALQAEFSVAEQAAIEQIPTSSPAAYALYLQAGTALGGPGGIATAHDLLDRAIAVDPEFVDAYAFKAGLYAASFTNTVQGAGVATADFDALEARVREYLDLTFALDPMNRSARRTERAMFVPRWRWSDFEAAFAGDAAQSLGPAGLWVHSWMGKHDEALRLGRRMVELNPNGSGAHLLYGVVLAYAGDREASNARFQRALEIVPANTLARAWLGYNYIAADDEAAALAELQILEQVLGGNRPIVYLPELAYSYARLGRGEDVARIFAEIEALGETADFGDGTWAMAYLAVGDQAQALARLERVAEKARNHEIDQGYLNIMNLKMNFLGDPLVETPAFTDVLNRIRGD